MPRTRFFQQWGVTLPELLIALVILGVIATLLIQRYALSSQTNQRNAVLKETLSNINAISYRGIISRLGLERRHFTHMSESLNYVRICTSDSDGNGCWPSPGTCS